jgi:hypothetical protein
MSDLFTGQELLAGFNGVRWDQPITFVLEDDLLDENRMEMLLSTGNRSNIFCNQIITGFETNAPSSRTRYGENTFPPSYKIFREFIATACVGQILHALKTILVESGIDKQIIDALFGSNIMDGELSILLSEGFSHTIEFVLGQGSIANRQYAFKSWLYNSIAQALASYDIHFDQKILNQALYKLPGLQVIHDIDLSKAIDEEYKMGRTLPALSSLFLGIIRFVFWTKGKNTITALEMAEDMGLLPRGSSAVVSKSVNAEQIDRALKSPELNDHFEARRQSIIDISVTDANSEL